MKISTKFRTIAVVRRCSASRTKPKASRSSSACCRSRHRRPSPLAHQPGLQLAPSEFFSELLDQYLLAALYGLLYESLAAESRQRLAHMEHALDRLDETVSDLALKRNALRQVKIVEEIEVILSSEQAFAERR